MHNFDVTMHRVSRRDAAALGNKTYYTGHRCVHSHDAERYVSTRACVECTRLKMIQRRRKR